MARNCWLVGEWRFGMSCDVLGVRVLRRAPNSAEMTAAPIQIPLRAAVKNIAKTTSSIFSMKRTQIWSTLFVYCSSRKYKTSSLHSEKSNNLQTLQHCVLEKFPVLNQEDKQFDFTYWGPLCSLLAHALIHISNENLRSHQQILESNIRITNFFLPIRSQPHSKRIHSAHWKTKPAYVQRGESAPQRLAWQYSQSNHSARCLPQEIVTNFPTQATVPPGLSPKEQVPASLIPSPSLAESYGEQQTSP